MTSVEIYDSIKLNSLFVQKVSNLPCHDHTKSYIAQLMTKPKDMSKDSITLAYAQAKFKYNFEAFKDIGDWLFWAKTISPKHLNHASAEYYDAIAQNSYYYCYRIINKKWPLFEELADIFPEIVMQLHNTLFRSAETTSLGLSLF